MIKMAKVSYYGKYRAIVQRVNDPEKRGRIRVSCPKVLGKALSNWCEPCIPVAYDNGGDFMLPRIGEAIWVEFEEGDVNKPVYTGGWWSSNKTPSDNYSPKVRHIEWNGCKIKMQGSDNDVGELIEIAVGNCKVSLTPDSVKIVTPKGTQEF